MRWNEGPIGEAAAQGVPLVVDTASAHPGAPIACVPLLLGELVVGVIAIYALMPQKATFVPLDYELFSILSHHAAAVLTLAGLSSRTERINEALAAWPRLEEGGS